MCKHIRNRYYIWRFYTLGHEEYKECMSKIFTDNLHNLRLSNRVVCILALCFAFFPIVIENNPVKAGTYFAVSAIALFLTLFAGRMEQRQTPERTVSNRLIYTLIVIYYVNLMTFGIYLGVWSNPNQLAVTFMTFLICALCLLIIPPTFSISLMVCAVVMFIISSVIVKSPQKCAFDITNVLIAGSAGSFFNWQVNRLRIFSALNVNKLAEERNNYLNQSTVDDLTQLRNRRDFTQTFQRYLEKFRSSDECLCVAILDIDYFKDYNDYYGHPQGDQCLRLIGKALNGLAENMGLYTARVGGEEFALLWFEKEADHAIQVSGDVHSAIRDLDIPHIKSKIALRMTVSMGIHISPCGSNNDTQTLYRLADKSLYTAKRSGRNCSCISSDKIGEPVKI